MTADILTPSVEALVCREISDADHLVLTDFRLPEPGPDDVEIMVEAAGVNFPDGLIVQGRYQVKPPLPFVPGCELVGTVVRTGGAASGPGVGDRVVAFSGTGAFARRAIVPAAQTWPVPRHVPAVKAAGLLVTYGTACHALRDHGRLAAGERVLVLGAGGGVGLAAVEIARLMGGHVVAVASTGEKRALALRQGAAEAIAPNALGDVKSGGGPIDIVVDMVGGDQALTALRQLAWGGRHLAIGFASGDIPAIPANRLLLNAASAIGVLWGTDLRRRPAHHAALVAELVGWLAEGRIDPVIDSIRPLSEGAAGIAHVMAGRAMGKVIIDMGMRA